MFSFHFYSFSYVIIQLYNEQGLSPFQIQQKQRKRKNKQVLSQYIKNQQYPSQLTHTRIIIISFRIVSLRFKEKIGVEDCTVMHPNFLKTWEQQFCSHIIVDKLFKELPMQKQYLFTSNLYKMLHIKLCLSDIKLLWKFYTGE